MNYYWIVGIAAAVLAVFIAYKVFNRKPAYVPARTAPSRRAARVEAARRTPAQAPRQEPFRQSRNEPPKVAPVARQGTAAAFCANCGARLNTGSNFCHVCGEKARIPS